MALAYKIDSINEAKRHVTFTVSGLPGGKSQTETRCDLPISDAEALDAELTRYAGDLSRSLEADASLAATTETKAMVGKSKTVEAEAPQEV